MSNLLTREEILQASDRHFEDEPCPEWGEGKSVRVWALTGTMRDAFEVLCLDAKGTFIPVNVRAKLLVFSLGDERGNRIFTEADIKALGEKNAAPLDRCFAIAQRLSGLRAEDIDALEKNSETDQADDSS